MFVFVCVCVRRGSNTHINQHVYLGRNVDEWLEYRECHALYYVKIKRQAACTLKTVVAGTSYEN